MKVVILAGGQPSTISKDREEIPKPMALIGEMPIIWHIMKEFAEYGFREFIICGGYKVETIKDYFADFYLLNSDITVDLWQNTIEIHKKISEDWKVTIVDTGLYTATGERIAKIKPYIDQEEFIVSYGDCLSDLNVRKLVSSHHEAGKLVTMVVAKPTGRNELVTIGADESLCKLGRDEKAGASEAWTDANIYIFNRQIFDYLSGNYSLETQLFKVLQELDQIHAYKHEGFWIPVETVRDRSEMESLWNAGIAPWKIWK